MPEMTLQDRREKWEKEHGLSRSESLIMRRLKSGSLRSELQPSDPEFIDRIEKRDALKKAYFEKMTRFLEETVAQYQAGTEMREIAAKAHISRQALWRRIDVYGTPEQRAILVRRKTLYIERACKCGTVMKLPARSRKKYCSKICGRKHPSNEAREAFWRKERSRLWREDAAFRKHHSAIVKANYLKRRHEPEYKKNASIYTKRFLERKRFGEARTPLPTK
jgi:DNA-binding phage protein